MKLFFFRGWWWCFVVGSNISPGEAFVGWGGIGAGGFPVVAVEAGFLPEVVGEIGVDASEVVPGDAHGGAAVVARLELVLVVVGF